MEEAYRIVGALFSYQIWVRYIMQKIYKNKRELYLASAAAFISKAKKTEDVDHLLWCIERAKSNLDFVKRQVGLESRKAD